ncbi:MAG: hypothetical protein ABJC19_05555 [Gemmatimonadota bacterium]
MSTALAAMTAGSVLAADLGHLADPAGPAPYDDVRLALLDAVVTAKGTGRLDHAAWQEAFEGAARSLRMRIVADAETALRAASLHSRYPSRRLAALLPDAEVSDLLLQRLLAEGIPLERLEQEPDSDSSRRARALAITAAWEGALRIARADAARWRALAQEVALWRRPVRPFWVAAGVLAVVMLVLALWLGGQLSAPSWFTPVRDAFWRLPWP